MTNPISSVTPTSSTTSTGATSPAAAASGSTDPLAQKETFLQLLVAQLKNQDPSQPTDGTQFVTQLAQFSQLEQSVQQTKDLDGIQGSLTQMAGSGTGSGTGTAVGGGN